MEVAFLQPTLKYCWELEGDGLEGWKRERMEGEQIGVGFRCWQRVGIGV